MFFLFGHTIVPGQAFTVFQLRQQIISQSAVLMDADTGQVLFEKNMHEVLRPASITKVMTALLALELGDLSDEVTMTNAALRPIAPTAARLGIIPNEVITLEEALYALAVVSAADTSNAIAEHISGTVRDFIRLMNERAKELGALNTNFVNTHGMPDNGHLTTAYDMALISMAAVNTPGFNEIFGAHEFVVGPTNVRAAPRRLRNLNKMITGSYAYEGILSGKTGWTRSSQHTLFTAATRDERTLICIVIKSPDIDDKYEDTTLLFDYGFSGFEEISFSIGELENYRFTDVIGNVIADDLTIHEIFTCLVPKSFSKRDVRLEYILESFEENSGTDDNESAENNENSNETENDDGSEGTDDSESTLDVRVVFTLDVSPDWPIVSLLGEVSGSARLVSPTDDEEEDTAENEAFEAEPPEDESQTPEPFVPELYTGPLEPKAPPLAVDEPVSATLLEHYLFESHPLWLRILRDVAMIAIPLIIIFCYIAIRKRRPRS